MLGIWMFLALLWHYLTFHKHKDSGVLLCRAIAGLPVLKVISLSLGVSFWATCIKWGMCSFWLNVAFINTNLIFDTALLCCFFLIAKGWSITRSVVPPQEWRGILVSMSVFYMANSIILVLEATVFTVLGFWIANIIVYGFMYYLIVVNVITQLKFMRPQVIPLYQSGLPRNVVGPLKMKYRMYMFFLVIVFAEMSVEILTHSLMFTDKRIWIALTFYEISTVFMIVSIGYIFRPREYSPFFFMTPTTMADQRIRPTPIIEVDLKSLALETESEFNSTTDGTVEIELQPLLPRVNSSNMPQKMMMVKMPDHHVSIAVSVAKRQPQSRPVQAQSTRRSSNHQPGSRLGVTNDISDEAFIDLTLGMLRNQMMQRDMERLEVDGAPPSAALSPSRPRSQQAARR